MNNDWQRDSNNNKMDPMWAQQNQQYQQQQQGNY